MTDGRRGSIVVGKPRNIGNEGPLKNLLRFLLFLCFLSASAARNLEAQQVATIRGEVVQSDGVTRASGVVIVASDSAGNDIARALSGSEGGFSMIVPAPATYAMRALRIGFRPTQLAPVSVAPGETKNIRVVLAGAAVQLSEVRVQGGQGSCRISADVGRFVGDLWEQARTVLMASTLSAGERPFEATLELYRQFTPKGEHAIAAETLEVVRRTTTSGFVSVSAELLASAGYVTIAGSRISYHAPDANALLSPVFAATHCFDVKAGGSEHPDWIGITFRPSMRRSGIADLEGTLWLDRATAELRTLEFTYVNLPRNAANGDADGSVSFTRLLTGDWIISRWAIRYPETEQIAGMGRVTVFRPIGRRVVGGITQVVRQDGGELYRDRGAAATFVLKTRDPANHGRGAFIGVDGLTRGVMTDSLGGITMTGLTEGRHKAHILTDLMRWVSATPIVREFDAEYGRSTVVTVELPKSQELGPTSCSTKGMGDAVFGTVTDAHGRLMGGLRVAVAWSVDEGTRRRRRAPAPNPGGGKIERVTFTDDAGRWRVCAPRAPGATVSVESETKVLLDAPLSNYPTRPFEPIPLRVP